MDEQSKGLRLDQREFRLDPDEPVPPKTGGFPTDAEFPDPVPPKTGGYPTDAEFPPPDPKQPPKTGGFPAEG